MQNFILFIKGELIKKKRSGFYWMAVVFGLFFPVAAFINDMFDPPNNKPGLSFNVFEKYFTESASTITSFFLVVLILQNASKIAQLDHKNGGWQLMELLPLKKTSIFFGKFLLLLSSNILLLFAYFVSGIVFTYLFFYFHEIPKEASIQLPVQFLLIAFIKILIASWLLTTIQYVLSVIIPSYIWALSIGLLGYIISSILIGVGMFQPFNPFHILNHTGQNLKGGDLNNTFLYTEYYGFFLGTTLLLIGFWWYIQKSTKRAFWKNWKTRILSLLIFSGLIIGSQLYLKPKTQNPSQKTIIAGEITSDYPIRMAYLVHPTMLDTLAQFAVSNGKFQHTFTEDLPLSSYHLYFQNYTMTPVVMGNLDSVYVEAVYQNNQFEAKIKGNRIAENQFKNNDLSWDYVKYQIEEGFNLDQYQGLQKELLKIALESLENLKSFRSKDNLTYRDDYKVILEKEIVVEHLLYKEQLEKKVKSLYPNKTIAWDAGWKSLENKVSTSDLQMLDSAKYLDYLQLITLKKDTSEVENTTKLLLGMKKLPAGEFKDKWIFSKLHQALEEANSSAERDSLIVYANQISSENRRKSLNFLYQNLKKLGKGNDAPNFFASALNGETTSLADLKGKWVVIDFWATWCGPCLYESPYFEKMAIKYQKENVKFLALSLDEQKGKWELEAKNKSKKVLQWHANQINQVRFDYQINSIPRFVVIDPDGKIYQAKMSRPSEASFEVILRKALGLKDLE
jgi:thiol-disulfide isomerase/thioredoxin